MALSKTKVVQYEAPPNSLVRQLLLQHNLVLNALRTICAKLDADAANTALNDTDYAAVLDATSCRLLSNATDTEITA
jgi:hypothetical protein